MPFAEPGTTLTDYLMGAQALFYACLLYMIGRRDLSTSLGVAMLDVAAAAILGGTHHGFNPGQPDLDPTVADHGLSFCLPQPVHVLWRSTQFRS